MDHELYQMGFEGTKCSKRGRKWEYCTGRESYNSRASCARWTASTRRS